MFGSCPAVDSPQVYDVLEVPTEDIDGHGLSPHAAQIRDDSLEKSEVIERPEGVEANLLQMVRRNGALELPEGRRADRDPAVVRAFFGVDEEPGRKQRCAERAGIFRRFNAGVAEVADARGGADALVEVLEGAGCEASNGIGESV